MFDPETYLWMFDESPCGGMVGMIVDHILIIVVVIIMGIFDLATLAKITSFHRV